MSIEAVRTTPKADAAASPPETDAKFGLTLLDFRLHEFTRMTWVSDATRSVWEPRLAAAREAWTTIEWVMILEGQRRCAVMHLPSDRFAQASQSWRKHDLASLIVETEAVPGTEGQSILHVAVGRRTDLTSFVDAWSADDMTAMAAALGTPSCCVAAQREAYAHSLTDLTWPTAWRSGSAEDRVIELEPTHVHANSLWVKVGVRAVPHLPCRFDCDASEALGAEALAAGRAAGFGAAADDIVEALSWPAEWSTLHGIAEFKTPIFRVASDTDATAHRHVVRWKGDRYPDDGARGLTFAYRLPHPPRLTSSHGFQKGLENPI